jgi:hypothetical protein
MTDVEYVCCFCTETVTEEDRAAVALRISNLWAEGGDIQALFAHSTCASEHLSRTGQFDPVVLLVSD